MSQKPIPDRELEQAQECWLVEPDGSRWEVLDVTVDQGRAWVRARRPPDRDNGGDPAGNGENSPGRLRVFDTVLSRRARLIWELTDGRSVEVQGIGDGELSWSVEVRGGSSAGDSTGIPPGEEETGRDGGSFFRDPFLCS